MTDLKIKGLAHIEYGVTKKLLKNENNWHDWGDELGVISGVLQNG